MKPTKNKRCWNMANWLSDRRKKLGLSQEDMVNLLSQEGMDISRGAISHWETGRTNPPLGNESFCAALAKILDVTPSQLLLMSGYPVADEYGSYNQEALRAADIVQNLSPDRRALALRVLEQFATN